MDKAVDSGHVFQQDAWKYVQGGDEEKEKSTMHFIGLLSDGGVHSRYDQLKLLMQGAAKGGTKRCACGRFCLL